MALQTKDPSTAVISSVGTAVSGGTTSDTKPVITGKADAGNIVVVYDGVRPIGSVIADANGNWTITPAVDLKAGAHNFAAIAHDTAGNFGASSALVNVTITSSAVTPPTPIITDDHGLPIVAGGTTADAKPQISGSGPAGDIITVYDGATPIGSTKINPDGKWTFTPTTDLSNATHAITVTDKVPGGTEGPHSGAAGFTVDTTVPATPSITSATNWNGDDRIGGVPVGAVVASPDVVILGKALAGAVVYVYDGATLVGSSVAQLNGSWSFENRAFAQGSHDITATVKNAAGTESGHSNHWTFSVDSSTPAKPAAPTVTDDNGATIVPGGTTNDAHPHIDGKGTPGDIIQVLDNGNVIGSTTVNPDGNWSFTPTTDLNNGPHDITVIDTNPAGTSSPASDPTHITIDTSVPDKPATPVLTDASDAVIPAGSTTNDGHPHISGTGKAGDTITVYDGTKAIGSTTVQPDGKWAFTPATDLSTGAHSISVTETNAAGTPSPKSDAVPFTYSLVSGAPVIESVVDAVGTITGPIVNGGVTDDSHPTISGKGVPGYTVYIFQNGTGCGDATVDATGRWTVTLKGALSDGEHVMTATQFTGSGAQSVVSNAWTITVDTSVPAKPAAPTLSDDNGLAIPAGSTTADTHPHIDGTGGKAGDTITVYDGGKEIGSTTVNPDGTWSFKPSPDLSPGTHDITVTDTNPAGATSPASDPTHITIDPSVPAAPPVPVLTDEGGALIPAGSTTADAHPYISGKGTAGDIITVYDGATPLGSVKIGTDGNWTFKPTTDLSNAGHSITVTDTNAAGTTGPHSGAVDFTVNTTSVPSITITGVYDQNHTLIPDHGSNTGTLTVEGTATGYANGDIVSLYFQGSALGDLNYIRAQIYNIQIVNGKFSVVLTADTKTGVTGTGLPLFSGNAGDIVMTAVLQNSAYSNKATGNTYSITETSWGASVPTAPAITSVSYGEESWTWASNMSPGDTVQYSYERIGGTGPANSVLYLYDGATLIGSTGVGATGTWSTGILNFSNGTHDLSATVKSAGGVESAHSNHWTFTIGAASVPSTPATPVLTDDNGSVIPAGSTTSDAHPHISGTGTAGDIIKVYDNGAIIGSTTIGTDGKWTYTPSSDMSTGAHSIAVTESNSAGTSGQSGSIGFNYSLVVAPPAITSVNYGEESWTWASGMSSGDTVQYSYERIGGTGPANSVVYLYDGATLIGSAKVGATGNWSSGILNFSNGTHDLSATAKSAGGVESAHSNHWTFTVTGTGDSTPVEPTTPINSGLTDPLLPFHFGSATIGLFSIAGDNNDTGFSISPFAGVIDSGTYSQRSAFHYGTTLYYTLTAYTKAGVYVNTVVGPAGLSNGYNPGGYMAFANILFSAINPDLIYVTSVQLGDINGQYIGGTSYVIDAHSGAEYLVKQPLGPQAVGWPMSLDELPASLGGTGKVSATHQVVAVDDAAHVVATDDATHAVAATDHSTVDANGVHHTAVDTDGTFHGTAVNGNETVDLNVDPAAYFKQATAHIEGSKGAAIDTLHLTGDHQVLDLTSLTGQTAAAKVSGIEVVDLGGAHNTLKLSLVDVLNLGETDLFQHDGKQQMMVKGAEGDVVDLSNSHIAGLAEGEWQAHGTTQVGGVTYNVYEHSGVHTELLVQQGVQIVVH